MDTLQEGLKAPTKASTPQSLLNYTVDTYADGVAFGQHKLEAGDDPRDHYHLRLIDGAELVKLRSRYVLEKVNPLSELERYLMRLSRQGVLGSATIYLGVGADPFFPFEGRFDASLKFLDIFRRYLPGLLVVQTRSPLVVIAMPVFKALGRHAAVTLGIETNSEEAIRLYTPGFPRLEERLKTARALRRFGVEVTLQVSPLIPYGDWREDAGKFAELLCEHGDYIYVRPLSDGSEASEKKVRSTLLAKALARDRKFHWLRPDAANPLISAIEKIAPDKLKTPDRKHLGDKQVKMFAA